MTFGKFAFRDCFSRTIVLLLQSRPGHNILGHLMRKLSIAFIALFIFSLYYNALPAHAQDATEQVRISAIKVSGNRRVAEGTVLSYLPVQIGDVVSQGGLSQSLERLFATNLFKDIKLDLDDSVLTVTIVENPIINRVNIEGNDVISDERLLEVIVCSRVGCITVSWRWMRRQGCLMFIGLGGALLRLLNQKSLS